jgi:hypothetical protein
MKPISQMSKEELYTLLMETLEANEHLHELVNRLRVITEIYFKHKFTDEELAET